MKFKPIKLMQKILTIGAIAFILLTVQFVSISATAQTIEAYQEAVRKNDFTAFCRDYPQHQKCHAIKYQAYKDADRKNDFIAFCRDYPQHYQCGIEKMKASFQEAKEKGDFTIFCHDYPQHWKCVDIKRKSSFQDAVGSNDFTSFCRDYPQHPTCLEIREKNKGKKETINTVAFIFLLIFFIVGAYWVNRKMYPEKKAKKKAFDENQKFKESIKQEFHQAKIHVNYYDPNDEDFLKIAKFKDIAEAQNKTNYDTSFLAIDFEKKQIVVGIREARESPPEQPYKMSFAFSDIVQAEIVRDGTQIATTNRGSQIIGAAVGAVALGGVGAVIGGLSASSTTLNGAKRIAIRITVDDMDKPIHEITFYTSKKKRGGKQGEKLFDHAVQKAAEFGAHLDTAIREAEKEQQKQPQNTPPENNQVLDVSEQISRLWQLKQEGALTQEEFEEQKTKLLHNLM